MTKTVAINGQPGSFHEEVLLDYFKGQAKPIYCQDFQEVFDKVQGEQVDIGLVAIENSLYGSINEVDALLLETGCQIIGETYLRVNFCLLGHKNADLKSVTNVYSQDIALAQCHLWLRKNLPNAKQINIGDTAGGAKFVNQSNNPELVAIASKSCAKKYDLEILAEEIENDKQNFTRFVIISKTDVEKSNSNKTSIVLKTANKPGALLSVLQLFSDLKINLTKLDSKPVAGKPWQYMFYIDFESGKTSDASRKLLSQLDQEGHDVHILGSYHAGEVPKS